MTPTVQAIAWTLIHFCWQGAAIALIYRCLSFFTTRSSSNARYVLALCALLLMLAASAATFAFEMRTGSSAAAFATNGADTRYRISPVKTPQPGMPQAGAPQPVASAPSAGSVHISDSLPQLPALPLQVVRLIDGLWLLGVLTLALRSIGGWWLIQRLRATATVEASAAVRASFGRIAHLLGLEKPVLLRVSSAIAGPVTVGALRALVLLPLSAVTSLSPDELEVVLAHELAHVRRADFVWNLVQTFVETLFFFHPAVWWIGGRIRHERELCCDDLALTVCPDAVVYAHALYRLEQQRSRQLQLAMALDGHQPGRTLRMRIARILGEPVAEAANRGPVSLIAAGAVVVILLLPVPQVLASLKPAPVTVHPQVAVSAPVSTTANVHVSAPPAAIAPIVAQVTAPAIAIASSSIRAGIAAEETAEPQQGESPNQEGKGNYVDRMKAAGYDVDLDKYIAMKIQDVTPEYAAAMSKLGFGKLSADDLIACKIQGVTPEFIANIKQGGLEVKSIQDAISYRIFDVSPEFIAQMKAAGFSGMSSQQLLAMRVQGVTPEYARSIVQQFPGATAEDIVKTRIFNIDAAFIEMAKKHGLTGLSLDKLVQLRISGIFDDESNKE
ncbi:MAG: M56 family metallopeptidase [Terracidiphilus sp.]|jgi:beta-lactamase regulating signal transducer with metallopeptidase domain